MLNTDTFLPRTQVKHAAGRSGAQLNAAADEAGCRENSRKFCCAAKKKFCFSSEFLVRLATFATRPAKIKTDTRRNAGFSLIFAHFDDRLGQFERRGAPRRNFWDGHRFSPGRTCLAKSLNTTRTHLRNHYTSGRTFNY